MTEIKRVQEYDNKKTSLPAPLNIIFRRSSLSVIVRLDRAICLRLRLSRFRILRSSRSMTTTKAITFLFVSLPDLIGQSIIFYLVFWDTPVMRSEYLTCKIKIIF